MWDRRKRLCQIMQRRNGRVIYADHSKVLTRETWKYILMVIPRLLLRQMLKFGQFLPFRYSQYYDVNAGKLSRPDCFK